jgi:uncharacterized Zn-finger protein
LGDPFVRLLEKRRHGEGDAGRRDHSEWEVDSATISNLLSDATTLCRQLRCLAIHVSRPVSSSKSSSSYGFILLACNTLIPLVL